MKRVVIESPYAGNVERNLTYARWCMADSLKRGEAPIASHLLYTQAGILDDNKPEERKLGIEAGFAWNTQADLVAVYGDYGVSSGMQQGIDRATALGIPVVWRSLRLDAVPDVWQSVRDVQMLIERIQALYPGDRHANRDMAIFLFPTGNVKDGIGCQIHFRNPPGSRTLLGDTPGEFVVEGGDLEECLQTLYDNMRKFNLKSKEDKE